MRYALADRDAGTFQGMERRKEPDSSYKPRFVRFLQEDWPSLVFECGVSESLTHLRVYYRWWLNSSVEEVKIVIIFSVSKLARRIHLGQCELLTIPNP